MPKTTCMHLYFCFSLRLLPILKVILKGVSKGKSPVDVIIDIIKKLENIGEKSEKENKENEEEKEEKEEKEGKENSGSGNPDNESQEDLNGAHEFNIKGPQEW